MQVQSKPSEEKFLDLSEVLRDCPDDFLFNDSDTVDKDFAWEHEGRFIREPPAGKGKISIPPFAADDAVCC